ncbi:MAG: RNA-binding transcriptional accessory protein [Rhodomicrobium sp.]|nr:MAG: RNA-binding transcriptional accessory protein [Rhodomicrobium sp.]
MAQIKTLIATEINARPAQVEMAVALIDEGATVPFIARYRKERTGGLDDTQLRTIETRLTYLRDLEQRRGSILKTITEQGKLSADLERQIKGATTRSELEDLYLPYKPKRRTKAQIAREAGLEPLAERIKTDPKADPLVLAAEYINNDAGVEDKAAALDGAADIIIETMSETAELVGDLRKNMRQQGALAAKVKKGKEEEGAKFSDYFDFTEDFHKVPSHRALALLRAVREGVISLSLDMSEDQGGMHPAERKMAAEFDLSNSNAERRNWLMETVKKGWKGKLHKKVTSDLFSDLRDQAETEAIRVFSKNLKDLLLAAPAGARATLGLDPGFRTGVKVAVVDETGKVVATDTIYPHEPRNDWSGSLRTLERLVEAHNIELISVGNGTASRETDKLAAELIKRRKATTGNQGKALTKVMVSEAGASVYSASELAAKEFPDLDVSLRGAVSIARRLQDPLAELVKIDPKAIGVGQYQHDVDQSALASSLTAAVEDCVNAVGVDLNMASPALLTYISGLNETLAQNIVEYRNAHGAFRSRSELKKVARLGPKAFEQAAGFLRIRDGRNVLDQSAVHPEAYELVNDIAKQSGRPVGDLIGDIAFLKGLDATKFATEQFGLPTVTDILSELEKPGRDPRPDFEVATFAEGVEKISDLKPGMRLEGVVTNVTNFGAFVDIGVHQDGLVHISQLADKFVQDPHEVVKAGEIVSVLVMEVDQPRKRIGLSMKSDAAGAGEQRGGTEKPRGASSLKSGGRVEPEAPSNPFADAFRKAGKTRH